MATREELIAVRNNAERQLDTIRDSVDTVKRNIIAQLNTLIGDVAPTIPSSQTIDYDEDLKPSIVDGRLSVVNDKDYIVTDLFTTFNGNWDNQIGQPYSIKQRFRDKFLKSVGDPKYIDDGGAQAHILVGVYDKDGNPIQGKEIYFNTKDNANPFTMPTKKSGFANTQMGPSSAYWPDNGQSGFWYVTLPGTTIKITGIGLINKWHVSTFIIIKKIT